MDTSQKNLLECIEEIVSLANKHKLGETFFESARPSLEALAKVLRITENQAAFLSLIIENSDDDAVSIGEIAKAMKCGRTKILKYMDDFEALEKKRLIRAERDVFSSHSSSLPSYYVPVDVIKAIRDGRPYRNNTYRGLSQDEFFDVAGNLFKSCQNDNISEAGLGAELTAMFGANVKSPFVQGIKTFRLGRGTATQFLAFCCAWLEVDDENIPLTCLRPFLGFNEVRRLKQDLKDGCHQLLTEGLIENGFDSGLANTETWTPTQKTRETFLAGLDLKEKKRQSIENIIPASGIQERRLFYNMEISGRVAELTSLLTEDNFAPIKQRLAGEKMTAAFTILFQGPPGTGKTETAYQIARLTSRDICLVDISDTKSCWFGESEKRIKAVFDRYKRMIRAGGITPILMFNEADAVLGKRQELGDTRRGPAQTENAIQNIILQEMENLHGGILIATTNLAANLDKAFERRFLYKIEFGKPDNKARAEIWRSRLSALSEEDAAVLSSRYDFSGGQIENIARKQAIKAVLNGTPVTLEGLTAICEDELMVKAAKSIGFRVD